MRSCASCNVVSESNSPTILWVFITLNIKITMFSWDSKTCTGQICLCQTMPRTGYIAHYSKKKGEKQFCGFLWKDQQDTCPYITPFSNLDFAVLNIYWEVSTREPFVFNPHSHNLPRDQYTSHQWWLWGRNTFFLNQDLLLLTNPPKRILFQFSAKCNYFVRIIIITDGLFYQVPKLLDLYGKNKEYKH